MMGDWCLLVGEVGNGQGACVGASGSGGMWPVVEAECEMTPSLCFWERPCCYDRGVCVRVRVRVRVRVCVCVRMRLCMRIQMHCSPEALANRFDKPKMASAPSSGRTQMP